MVRHTGPRTLMLAFAFCISATAAGAQQPAPDIGPLTSSLDFRALQDLPSTGNLFSLLETTQAEVVSDRFFGAVNPAEVGRLGVLLTSWAQTSFLVDGVDVTSADRGGPVFIPPVDVWQGVRVTSGAFPPEVSGPGLLISLEPLRPSSTWQTRAVGSGSGGWLVGNSGRLAAPIVRPEGWAQAGAVVGGPIVPGRAGILVSASMTRASQFERGSAVASEQSVDSIFSHLVLTPGGGDEVRAIGWRQVADAHARETSTHLQSTWERGASAAGRWRFFGAFTERAWNGVSRAPAIQVIERLVDGPVSGFAAPASGRERRWSAGWRTPGIALRTQGIRHALQTGADASRILSRSDAGPAVTVGELVGGIPARLWSYSASAATQRTRVGLAAFVSDTLRLSEDLTVEGALRFDRTTGTARGAAEGITWNTVLPRVSARW